jgi:hypothetical protein
MRNEKQFVFNSSLTIPRSSFISGGGKIRTCDLAPIMRLLYRLSFATAIFCCGVWGRTKISDFKGQRPAGWTTPQKFVSGQQDSNPHHALIWRSLFIRQSLYH